MSRPSGRKLSEKTTKDEGEEELPFVPSKQEPLANESTVRRIGPEVDEDLLIDDDERASEGEAPETMTAAAGLSQSRSLASKAARVLERYSFFIFIIFLKLKQLLVGLTHF